MAIAAGERLSEQVRRGITSRINSRIWNVFDADPADLSRISGIGESAAALIKLQSELARKYWLKDREAQSALSSVRAAVDYAGLLFRGKTKEEFYIVCLDSRFRIRHLSLIHI